MSLGFGTGQEEREHDKDNFALWMVMIVTSLLMIMALYTSSTRTHEKCLEMCEKTHKLSIDNSWHACEERCDVKFGKNMK